MTMTRMRTRRRARSRDCLKGAPPGRTAPVFEEGSLGAKLTIVVLITLGVAAAVWYQGRLWNNGLRLWHGAVLGLVGGVVVALLALD